MWEGLVEDRQFVKMRCKEAETADMRCNVSALVRQLTPHSGSFIGAMTIMVWGGLLADGPCKTETVVRRRSSTELIDDDQAVFRGRL